MIYRSLGEVFDEKQRILDSIGETVSRLSALQAAFRHAEEAWSVLEILEHLSIVEPGMLRLIGALAQKAGRAAPGRHWQDHFQVFIPEAATSDAQKYRTRPEFEPSGKLSIGESMGLLKEMQVRMFALRPALEAVDTSSVSFQHDVLGPLTLGQWVAFVGAHEQRHLRQIRAIIASPAFMQTASRR